MSEPFFTLYTAGTPNGHKVSVALEELGLPYKVYPIDFSKNEQKDPWFVKINPNGRIPAIVDHKRGDFNVFESGAILLYLAEHYDPEHKIFPADPNLKSEAIQWLMWQMGGLGPMQGQLNHFARYAGETIPYAIKRYDVEVNRLYSVLESHLADGREYIIGSQFSVADIAAFPWAKSAYYPGITFDPYPHVKAWHDRCFARPALRKGLDVPTPLKIMTEEEIQAFAAKQKEWILQHM
ncbi:glutathione S-transferase GstA, partial [Cladochytrium replicatum]